MGRPPNFKESCRINPRITQEALTLLKQQAQTEKVTEGVILDRLILEAFRTGHPRSNGDLPRNAPDLDLKTSPPPEGELESVVPMVELNPYLGHPFSKAIGSHPFRAKRSGPCCACLEPINLGDEGLVVETTNPTHIHRRCLPTVQQGGLMGFLIPAPLPKVGQVIMGRHAGSLQKFRVEWIRGSDVSREQVCYCRAL